MSEQDAMTQELGYLDMKIADGVFLLLQQQRDKLNKAIQVAEEFKTSSSNPAPKSAVKFNEEELAQEVKKDEEILAELAKQVEEGKAKKDKIRAEIAAKKGEKPKEPVAAAPSPEAEKWLEENLGDIKKSIAEQGEKLQAIIKQAEKCEESVSHLAKLRTRRVQVQNKIKFQRLALDALNDAIKFAEADLAKLG